MTVATESLLQHTLETVENWYHNGYINQSQWEAYTYLWVTSVPRDPSYDRWKSPLHPEAVVEYDKMKAALEDK